MGGGQDPGKDNMMYEVSVEQHFDAAHYLRGYGGRCENLHGHRFRVKVGIECTKLDNVGMAYDFADLKNILRETLARFDHTCLNDVPPFDKINPSSENIASTIYDEIQSFLPRESAVLSRVEVWESPDSSVLYRP